MAGKRAPAENLIEQISLFDAGRKITADEVAAYLPYAGGEFTPAVAPGEMLHSYEKEREMLFKMISRCARKSTTCATTSRIWHKGSHAKI